MIRKLRNFYGRIISLKTLVLAGVFTVADLLAGFLSLLYTEGILLSRFFRLSRDRGVAEIIGYLKFVLIIAMLVSWRRVKPARLLSAWIILFSIMLADDSLGIHEAVGASISPFLYEVGEIGVRVQDLAEIVGFAALEGSALLYVGYCYLMAPADQRAVARIMALGLAPLVFCGFVLDLMPFWNAEQIGEMAAMTVLLAVVHCLYRKHVIPGAEPTGYTQ
jgi:hypothetical protein